MKNFILIVITLLLSAGTTSCSYFSSDEAPVYTQDTVNEASERINEISATLAELVNKFVSKKDKLNDAKRTLKAADDNLNSLPDDANQGTITLALESISHCEARIKAIEEELTALITEASNLSKDRRNLQKFVDTGHTALAYELVFAD